MDYPKSVPNVGLVGGKFVDENINTGQVGSLIPSAWGTAVTDEIINVIKAGEIAPKENENNQLALAIKEIIKKNSGGLMSSGPMVNGAISSLPTTQFIAASEGNTTDIPPGMPFAVGLHIKYPGPVGVYALDILSSVTGEDFRVRYTGADGPAPYRTLYHSGNFDPNSKVSGENTTRVGFKDSNPNYPYIWSKSTDAAVFLQKRLEFPPVQQGGGIGQTDNKVNIGWSATGLKASVDNLDLGLVWCENNFKPSEYIKKGQYVPSFSNPAFGSGNTGAIATVPTVNTGSLQITNEGNAAASASICFHRSGVYAAYLGLDTDNQFKVGGASMGLVSHTLWHSGNKPKDTALLASTGWSKNADTGEIKQWLEVAVDDIPTSKSINITWPFQFPNQFINARPSFRKTTTSTSCVQAYCLNPTKDGCTIYLEEWSGVVQSGIIVCIEARGN